MNYSTSFDDTYIIPALTMVMSLLENGNLRKGKDKVVLYYSGENPIVQGVAEKLSKRYGIEMQIEKAVDVEDYADDVLPGFVVDGKEVKAYCARIFDKFNMIEDVPTVWIDSDCIVVGDVSTYFIENKLTKNEVYGCTDFGFIENSLQASKLKKKLEDGLYINAGFLYFPKYKKRNIIKEVRANKYIFPEQDYINDHLNVGILPWYFNAQTSLVNFQQIAEKHPKLGARIESNPFSCAVLHYVGSDKPWDDRYQQELRLKGIWHTYYFKLKAIWEG